MAASRSDGIYSRPRVSALLDRAARGTLVTVVEPAGYGKTTAVADYLASGAWDYTVAWVDITTSDNHVAHFWKHLCETLVRTGMDGRIPGKLPDPAAAEPSEALEIFAETIESFKEHLRREKRWHRNSRIAIVLDDFHLIESSSILRFVADAASLGIRSLRFFTVGRTMPVFPVRVRRLSMIGAGNLIFDRAETAGWLKSFYPGLSRPDRMSSANGRISDMQMLAVLSGNGEDRDADSGSLERIFERYSPFVQVFLLRISVLEEFPVPLCAAVAECTEAEVPALMRRVAEVGVLVTHGAIHHILRDFLREKLRTEDVSEWSAALGRATEWYRAGGDLYAAANCCLRSGDSRMLARIMSDLFRDDRTIGTRLNDFARDEFRLRRKLFESIPPEILRSETPLSELFYIFTLIQLRDMEALSRRVAGIRAHYLPQPESADRNRILGELELMGTALVYNDFRRKAEAFARAQALLNGPSLLARASPPVLFGSPSALILYYNEFRPLDEIVSDYALHWQKYDELLGGSFSGLEELLRGEVAYERADFAPVGALAGLALKKARQYGVAMAAHFLLARLALTEGRLDGVLRHLREIFAVSLTEKRQQAYATVDFCFGLIGAMLGEPEIAPRWLRDGNLVKSRGIAVGIGIRLESFPYAFILAASNRFGELARVLPEIRTDYERARTRMGLLHCAICDALLRDAAGDPAGAGEALRAAWQMAEPDGLLMPFVERSVPLYPLVLRQAHAARRRGGNDKADEGGNDFGQWLDRMEGMMKHRNRTVLALRRTYLARRGMLRRLFGADGIHDGEGDGDFLKRTLLAALSPREAEVFALHEAGAGNGDIAARIGLRRDNLKNVLLHIEEKVGLLRNLR